MRGFKNLQAAKTLTEKVVIPNFVELERKILEFPEKFAVISDFDFTMTKYRVNENQYSTTSLMRALLPDKTLKEAEKLFEFYHPIELNFNLDPDERSKRMQEWWLKEYALFTSAGLRTHNLVDKVLSIDPFLRHGVIETFNLCNQHSIPMHVLSAGIGNFIHIIFKLSGISCDIRANLLTKNSKEELAGCKEPLITSANKSKSVSNLEYSAVIVLGDMPSDVASVPTSADHKILIGFLNDTKQFKAEEFYSKFDIVVEGDGNFNIASHVIRTLLRNKGK